MSDRLSPPERIKTQRLVLRRVEEKDAREIYERWGSDPEVTRYLSWRTQEGVHHAAGYVQYALQAWEEGSDFIWMIEEADGELIGGISFGVDQHRAIFGFVLRKESWGKVYTTEALRALVEWLDDQPTIRRAEACCSTENVASRRVLEKAGFVHEGTLRKWMVLPNLGDDPQDMHMLARVK